MLWLLVLCLLCLLYVYLTILLYPGNLPTLPGRLPILGHIWYLFGNSAATWKTFKRVSEFALKNGDVILYYFGIIPVYFITDPDDCSKVLHTCLHKPGFLKKISRQYLGNALLFGPVSIWKEHRKLLNPTFNQQVLDSFLEIFNTQSRRLIDEWKNLVKTGTFDQQYFLEKNALETICWTTAGVNITEQSDFNEKCLVAFRNVISTIMRRVQNPLYLIEAVYKGSQVKKDEDHCISVINKLIDRVIKKHREERNPNVSDAFTEDVTDTKFKPFLYRLLDQNNVSVGDKDIKDEMNNIILTGFETSSSTLTFALTLLGTHPDVQDKCYQEICEVLGESDRDVYKDDLSKLKYLDAVLKETLRFCSVAPMTARIIAEDIQLKNVVLRKNHICFISFYGVLNHSSWGPNVRQFIPERWLEPGFPQNPNLFGAFGYGRRNCIGKMYALMTMKVTLVHILRHYKLTGNYSNLKIKNKVINKPARGHEISIELRKR